MRTTQTSILLEADDADALRAHLARIDTDVPLRSEGRTTEQTERYAIAHLLATLPAPRFSFPLTVVHGDRPDFFIEECAGRRIAIEHVEAVPENEAKKAFLREVGDSDGMHFIGHAEPGEPRRSTKRLLKEIEVDDAGDGWTGDSVEREWANAVAHFATQKARSVQKDGYDRGDETWLLMYDNWPLPHVKPETAASYFVAHPAVAEIFGSFGRVFVMDGQGVWEFSAGLWEYHALKRPH